MKISFDLDGVIAKTDRWFFRVLELLRGNQEDMAYIAELDYYSSLHLKHHPHFFLADGDDGIIITCRKPYTQEVTEEWLRKFGIYLPVHFADYAGIIDWTRYEEGSVLAAELKARILLEQRVDIHFDNNPILVSSLRGKCPEIKVILCKD